MAFGGNSPLKEISKMEELAESISPDKIDMMVDIINHHSKFKVVSVDEYNKIHQHDEYKTSTPVEKDKPFLGPDLPPPSWLAPDPDHIRRDRRLIDATNLADVNLHSYSKPRIPIFSGEEKSECSFEVWKYEVKCICREGNYTNTILSQCIRGSLKGKARNLLLSLPENATPTQIVDKLEGVYGNVFSSEALLQRFYGENQQPNQSVAEYGMKLESLIQLAVEKGQINPQAKNEMLRSKFWSGLRDPLLKNASRYKYDTVMDFDQLRKEIRSIELDLSNYSNSQGGNTKVQQHASTVQSDKLDELLNTVKSLHQRMQSVEGELRRYKEVKKGERSNVNDWSRGYDPGQFQNQGKSRVQNEGQFRGQYRGQFRGQYRGPSRGQFRGGNGQFENRGGSGNRSEQDPGQLNTLNM